MNMQRMLDLFVFVHHLGKEKILKSVLTSLQ